MTVEFVFGETRFTAKSHIVSEVGVSVIFWGGIMYGRNTLTKTIER